jgi:hypothetical protein
LPLIVPIESQFWRQNIKYPTKGAKVELLGVIFSFSSKNLNYFEFSAKIKHIPSKFGHFF